MSETEDLHGAVRTLLRLYSVEAVLRAVAENAGKVERRPDIQRNGRGERIN